MKNLISIILAIVSLSIWRVQAFETEITEYHGFHINTRQLSNEQRDEILQSLYKQLDIVESVNFPEDILRFLRSVPISIDSSLKGSPGQYTNRFGTWLVLIRPVIMADNKPILLHELLHAYHFNVLTLNNREILEAYQKAKESNGYPPDYQSTHFLENAKEYFAVTGTIYLFGDIQQPPFNCAVLSKLEPEYLEFMAKVFGQHQCN